jgi:hypothetical protein
VNRLILPLFVGGASPRRFADPELDALFGGLLATDPPELRRIVAEYLLLDRDRNAGRAADAINDELVRLQAGLARERLAGLEAAAEQALTAAVRQLVAAELLGASGVIASTAKFVGERQVARLTALIAREETELAQLQGLGAPGDAQKARMALLVSSIKSLKANKSGIESSLR